MPDNRFIVALDLPDAVAWRQRRFLQNRPRHVHRRRPDPGARGGRPGQAGLLDIKLYDIGATVEKAVAGLAKFGLDFLTVHGDPQVVRAAIAGRGDAPTRIFAVTILTSLDRGDLDQMLIQPGDIEDLTVERARRALAAGGR